MSAHERIRWTSCRTHNENTGPFRPGSARNVSSRNFIAENRKVSKSGKSGEYVYVLNKCMYTHIYFGPGGGERGHPFHVSERFLVYVHSRTPVHTIIRAVASRAPKQTEPEAKKMFRCMGAHAFACTFVFTFGVCVRGRRGGRERERVQCGQEWEGIARWSLPSSF